ncbi:MAG: hypothetical protein DRP89_02765 [Candidatus Neomarinimicrobiota bacterium]|nr:MAG: hypothetical protein DRP89_02765 [Candidatus Neomarinimicrobiota bacterium]
MRKLLIFSLFLVVLTTFVFGGWEFESVFYTEPGTEITNAYGAHGIAVDPAGNIWFGMYNYPTDSTVTATDTIYYYGPRVFDPSGTELSMSPIKMLTIDGVTDTLFSSCRGLATDKDGNILLTVSGALYRINYQTGEGMNKYVSTDIGTGSWTKAGVDAEGRIFIAKVVPGGGPIKILNHDFTELGNAVSSWSQICRALQVSADGKDLYTGSTWNGKGIIHFHSDIPGVLEYTPVDTIGNRYIEGVLDTTWIYTSDTTIVGTDTTITIDTTFTTEPYYSVLWPEDITIGPEGKVIYAANTQGEWSDKYRGSRWLAFDLETGEELYTIGTPEFDPEKPYVNGAIWNGRGAAWSADGNTMYLIDFGYCNITKWSKTAAVDDNVGNIVRTFSLYQNFPNPFNPTTTIPFTIENSGLIKLIVYDMLGHEVATLVNKKMNPGSYKFEFDATQHATGMYIYRLTVDGKQMAKKMLYVK